MQILPATSALECTKLMKVGIFLKLNTLELYPVHFGIIEGLVTSLCQASKLYIVRGSALLALAHEMFN